MLITIIPADRPALVRGVGMGMGVQAPASSRRRLHPAMARIIGRVSISTDVVPASVDAFLPEWNKRSPCSFGVAGSQAPMSAKAWHPARRAAAQGMVDFHLRHQAAPDTAATLVTAGRKFACVCAAKSWR